MMEERASLWLMVVAASAHWMAVGATKLERNSMGHRWRNLQEEGGKCFKCTDAIEIQFPTTNTIGRFTGKKSSLSRA